MQNWEVWSEGFVTNGETGTAQYHGTFPAETFRDAVQMAVATFSEPQFFDPERLTYWGCKFYPSESEARQYFG